MILYILKTVLCAFFFLIVYHCLFEKDKALQFRRLFLLGTLVFSMLIPLVGVFPIADTFQPIDEITDTYIDMANSERVLPVVTADENIVPAADIQRSSDGATFSWMYVIAGFYMLVVLVLIVRFIRNLWKLIKLSKRDYALKYGKTKIIVEEGLSTSFSFFNSVFIDKDDYENKDVRTEILIHELTHVRQKHSADVLFVELLIAFCWFNPALYLYRRAMKLNHEYLADEEVINNTCDVSVYQMILINRAAHSCNLSFVSSLTYLITKKRLIMMTRTRSKRNFLFKLIVLAPAILIAGIVFSAKINAETNVIVAIEKVTTKQGASNDDIIIPGSGVSPEQMDEYSKIVSKYLGSISDGKVVWESTKLSDEDETTLFLLYVRMSEAQQKQQLIKFMTPFTPFKLRSPNQHEWNACIKKNEVWFDGKRIDFKTANTHSRKSILFFMYSHKEGTAYLWTKNGYEEYMKQYAERIVPAELLKLPKVGWFTQGYDEKIKVIKNERLELVN